MPIWTQEQLYEIVLGNYKAIEKAKSNPETPKEQIEAAEQQMQTMETWLDAEFRDQLDVMLGRLTID